MDGTFPLTTAIAKRLALRFAWPWDSVLAENVAAPDVLTVNGFPVGEGPPSLRRAAMPTFAAFRHAALAGGGC